MACADFGGCEIGDAPFQCIKPLEELFDETDCQSVRNFRRIVCIVLKAGKVRTIVLIGILTVVSYHGFKTSTMMC